MPVVNKLTVFVIKSGQSQITHRTYSRPGENFFSGASGFGFEGTIPFPAGGINTDSLCVINRNGANNGSTLDLFVRKTNNTLAWATSSNGGASWSAWNPHPNGGTLASAPAASTFGAGKIVLFVKGADGLLYRSFYTSGSWNNWQSMSLPSGVIMVGDPAVIGRTSNSYYVYIRGNDNKIWRRHFNETVLESWEPIISNAASSPEGIDMQHEDEVPPAQPFEEATNIFYKDSTNNTLKLHWLGVDPSSGGVLLNWSGTPTSTAAGVHFIGNYQVPYGNPNDKFREVHVFVKGVDNKLYGRWASRLVYGQANPPAANAWYRMDDFGIIVGKPDAVTWVGGL